MTVDTEKKSKAPQGIEVKNLEDYLTIYLPPVDNFWMRLIKCGHFALAGCFLLFLCFIFVDTCASIILIIGAGILLIVVLVDLLPKRKVIKVFNQGIEVYEAPSYNIIKPLIHNIIAVYPRLDREFADREWCELIVDTREQGAQFLVHRLQKSHAQYISSIIQQYLHLDIVSLPIIPLPTPELHPIDVSVYDFDKTPSGIWCENTCEGLKIILRTDEQDRLIYEVLFIGFCILLGIGMGFMKSPSVLVIFILSGIMLIPSMTSLFSRFLKGSLALIASDCDLELYRRSLFGWQSVKNFPEIQNVYMESNKPCAEYYYVSVITCDGAKKILLNDLDEHQAAYIVQVIQYHLCLD